MFSTLPAHFRKYGLRADVRILLLLQKGVERNLVRTLGDLYVFLKSLVTNEPKEFGPFVMAFYAYFLDVNIQGKESLKDAVLRSETFVEWLAGALKDNLLEEADLDDLINQFLDEVHLTQLDVSQLLDATSSFEADDPKRADSGKQDDTSNIRTKDALDYRDIPLDELRKRMEEVARRQRERHQGGDHWLGKSGTSPYGNEGNAAGGIRKGGNGGGKMARQVVENRAFYPIDTKAVLRDDNIDAALAALKGIEESATEQVLDIPITIKEGLKQGGIFLPYEREDKQQKLQVLLLVDNGGFSMSPYVKSVKKLFTKMKTRFAHDLKTYYFHNTIYGGLYANAARTQFVPLQQILKLDKNYSLFVVGDADMAPYELDQDSIREWTALKMRFRRSAWLNPMRERFWRTSTTTTWIQQVFSMFPLTPEGIEKAVLEMNRKRGNC
ncbi:MAG: hypothetical protein AAF849_11700 [Bacteroidota bacterium]